MGRQVINDITCANCKRNFNVATEDIKWEHLEQIGESNDNGINDYFVNQSVVCPHCHHDNKILFKAKGKTPEDLDKFEVISMEKNVIFD